jgi:nucleoside-diphosphate-sugar epimerase
VSRKKVLITGASGLIGGLVIERLGDRYAFSGLSRRPVAGIPHLQADVADAAAIRPAFTGIYNVLQHAASNTGIDTVLHLAAANQAHQVFNWDETMRGTVWGTINVYEAAREAGVQRIIHLSSGCAQLAYEWDNTLPYGLLANGPDEKIPSSWPMVEPDWPVRPDSPYAIGKLFGEHLGRYYADKHGISTLVIRLGGVFADDKPELRRHYCGYLSQSDCVQVIDKCLSAPAELKFDIFNAISENRYKWRSTEHTKEVLGWAPTASAERAGGK